MQPDPASNTSAPPLFVDLDGTLVRTDTLHEGILAGLKQTPLRTLGALLSTLTSGVASVKRRLVDAGAVADAASLPYRPEVVEFLKAERASGRPVVLATASDQIIADRVAAHLRLFDDAIGSDGSKNLKAKGKLIAIREYCNERGWQGFAYMGDSSADLPIWEAAEQTYVVNAPASLQRQVEKNGRIDREFRPEAASLPATLAKALRPHQWVKNILIFAPLVLAHQTGSTDKILAAVAAFTCLSLCASAGYLINDLLDLESDRRHEHKRLRPMASGAISVAAAGAMTAGLLAVSFGTAAFVLPGAFTAVLAAYLVTTISYSVWIKRQPILDVMVLAGLYSSRLVAGGAATDVEISAWLFAFSGFLFTSLAFAKRYTELRQVLEAAGESAHGRGYVVGDLNIIQSAGPTSGYLSVLVLALYISSQTVQRYYKEAAAIWMVCPLLLYWITRVWLLAGRGELHHDPVVFAIKDPISRLVGAAVVALFVLGVTGWRPF